MLLNKRLFVLTVLLGTLACGGLTESPPLDLSYRDSLMGAGKIVQIKSLHTEPLTDLQVTLKNPAGETREYKQVSLAPSEAFEIGWKKLGGWEIVEGTEIEVRCEGFGRPFSGKVGA